MELLERAEQEQAKYPERAAEIACPGGWYYVECDEEFENFRLVCFSNHAYVVKIPEDAKHDQVKVIRFAVDLLEQDLSE